MYENNLGQRRTIGFEAVDQTKDPLAFARYLNEVNSLETIRRYKDKVHALLRVRDGDSILDVGCGIGIDTEEIAVLFGPNIKIVGIDSSELMIGIANLSLSKVKNLTPIAYAVQDAHSLSFGDNEFDISRADRTLQHLIDPRKALREMIRVTKSGGKILLVDTNWGSMNIKGISRANSEIIKKTYGVIVLNPNIAVRLKELMVEEGIRENKIDFEKTQLTFPNLASIEVVLWIEDSLNEAEKMGVITQEDKLRCIDDVKRVNPDSVQATVDLYIARGIKT